MAIGDNEVGRVTVRVVPDYSGFRDKVQKKLEEIEREDVVVPIKGDLDDSEAEAKLNKLEKKPRKAKVDVELGEKGGALDRFQKRLLADLSNAVSKAEVKIPLTLEGEQYRRDLEKLEVDYSKKIRNVIDIDLEVANDQRNSFLDAVNALVKKASRTPLEFKLTYSDQDQVNFGQRADKLIEDVNRKARAAAEARFNQQKADLRRVAEAAIALDKQREAALTAAAKKAAALDIAAMQKRSENYSIQLELDDSLARLKAAQFKADFSRSKVEVLMDVSPWSLAEARRKVNTIFDVNPNDKRGGLSAGVLAGAAGLMAASNGVRNSLSGMASGLSKAAGAVSGFGERMLDSASKVRMFGVGMIPILAIATLIPPALAAAMGAIVAMPAALAGFLVPIGAIALGLDGIKKAAESVEPQFKELRDFVSGKFEDGLTPVFKQLADGLFPALQKTIPSVVTGLTNMAKGFTDVVTSQSGLDRVKGITTNIGQALSNAAPGIRDFTDGMLTLVDRVAAKFPGLGTAFSGMMQDFLGWVNSFTAIDEKTGVSRLDTAMTNLRTTAQGLWGLLGQIAGVSLDNLNRPGFGEGIKDFFKAVGDFVTNTLPGLMTGFENIAAVADKLSPVFRVVGLLANGLEMTKDIFSAATKPGGLKENAKDMESMQAAVARMQESAKNGGSFIDQWVVGATGMGNPAEKFLQDLPQQAGAAGQQSVTAFTQSFNQDLPVGTPISGAEQVLKPAVEAARQAGVDAGAAFQQGIAQPVPVDGSGQLLTGVTTEIAAAEQQIAGLGPKIQGQIDLATAPLDSIQTKIGTAFQNVGTSISNAMQSAVESARTKAGEIPTAIQGALFPLPNIIATAFNPMKESINTAMGEALTTVQTKIGEIVTECSGIGGKVSGAVGDLSGTLRPAGEALASGLRSGLEAGMAGVLDYARTIAGQIAAVKGPLPKDRKTLVPAGEALMEGLDAGMQSGFEGVLSRTKQMAKAIFEAMKEVFGSAEGANINFNIGGMADSMASVASSAQSFQKTMATSVAPAVGGDGDLMGYDLAGAKARIDELKEALLALEIQRKELMAEKYAGGDKDIIKAKLDEIAAQKNLLGLEKDRLTQATKYGAEAEKTNSMYSDLATKGLQAPVDFANAVGGQFMSDIGMSGNGAIPTLASAGINYVMQFANFDQALSGLQTIQNRNALQYTQR